MTFGALVYPQRWCEQTQPHYAHVWVTSNGTYASCAGHSGETELRERVEALADGWDESSASGHPDCDIDADCVACAAAELRAILDVTAAPTTDTGARDG